MNSIFGSYELLAKSGLFDGAYYSATNLDAVGFQVDPLLHYLEQGAREGLRPNKDFDVDFYLAQCAELGERPDNPLLHFVITGAARGLRTNPDGNGPAEAFSRELGSLLHINLDEATVTADADGGLWLDGAGWMIAGQQISEISVRLGDKPLGLASYGLHRPDVAMSHPNAPNADRSGFSFHLPLPADMRPPLDAALLVRSAARNHDPHPFRVETLTDKPASPALDPQPRSRGAAPGPAPAQLSIDSISLAEDGMLHIEGWAISLAPLAAVEILVDDEPIGAAEIGRPRDDVALSWPGYPNARQSGFLFIANIADEISRAAGRPRGVTVRAVARGGITREVIVPFDAIDPAPSRPAAALPDQKTVMHCDEIILTTGGRLKVAGWIVPPTPLAVLTVVLDGQTIGEASIGRARPDVGNEFPARPHARQSGFFFDGIVGQGLDGEHLVELHLRDSAGTTQEIPLPVRAVAGEPAGPAESAGAPVSDITMMVDSPAVTKGRANDPLRGSLTINGWALARAGVAAIGIHLDDVLFGDAYYGVRREDVAAVFPDREDARLCGFAALIPARALSVGPHAVRLVLRDKAGGTASCEFSFEVAELPEDIGPWSLRRKMTQAEIDLEGRVLAGLDWRPSFDILMRIEDTPTEIERARRTIASLEGQAYPEWRLTIISSKPASRSQKLLRALSEGFDDLSGRLRLLAYRRGLRLDACAGPAGSGNKSDGRQWLGFLLPGDELAVDALLEFAVEDGLSRDAELIYADERRESPVSGEIEAFFKPDWSPDLLLSMNYIGRPWFALQDLWRRSGVTLDELGRLGQYDAVLRCSEAAAGIRHVPKVLCQRDSAHSDSGTLETEALERALGRRAIAGEVGAGCLPGIYRVRREHGVTGLVSIIIPTCAAGGLIKTCLDTLASRTAYRNFEVVCIENIPKGKERRKWKNWLDKHADRVVSTTEPFNWSRFNNLAAAEAKGEFLVFLNDDIEILDPEWLDALLEHAARPEVGVVGPRLLYPDRRVQHAGLFLSSMGTARHAFRFADREDPGYFGFARTQRNMIGVTGACLVTRREVFDTLGRFDETHTVVNNDLDYCLRVHSHGLLTVYTPHTTLIHHELASRSAMSDDYDVEAFESRWREVFHLGDPYHHPSLSKRSDEYMPELEPLAMISAGHPVFARNKIRRILVLKLDHIGDCVMALPAIRRLKRHFPEASLHVLSGRSSQAIWSTEPSIDGTITFDFFHARSELGPRELTAEDLAELQARLAPHHFDLAVDLRKSPDTRPILQYTGARYLAGFDSSARFLWLDIAVEWEGDHKFATKRQHVSEGLLALVEEIAAQTEPLRATMRAPMGALEEIESFAPIAEAMLARPLVCIHPGVGTPMRQWPASYFTELVDLLVAREGVNIVLIGGPDEQEIADAVLGKTRNTDHVFSLVGKVKLTELPLVLAACRLYVGNNSGPKHIAAGLGVPTVGVHSGVIDSTEWGPMGPAAVAVRRNMSCSPCYLVLPSQCNRGLACLSYLSPGEVYGICRRLMAIPPSKSGDGELLS